MISYKTFLGLSAAFLAVGALAQQDVLFQAMEDSLNRSMQELSDQATVAPYFIAYTLHEDEQLQMSSKMGGVYSTRHSSSNSLEVNLRVGSYEMDNTNFLSSRFSPPNVLSLTASIAPQEFDYEQLRLKLWLLTDGAYKRAVEAYGEKTTALNNNSIDYGVPDYSQREPVVYRDDREHGELNKDAMTQRLNEISTVLLEYPELFSTNAFVNVDIHQDYYMDTEGTSFTRVDDIAETTIRMNTRAENGADLADVITDVVRTADQFESLDTLKAKVRSVADTLTAMRTAPEMENYNGPVLFVGQAATEVIAQILGSVITAEKNPVRKSGNNISIASSPRNPFQARIGARVLPRDFLVFNDSTIGTYHDHPLHGYIPIDSEGVPSTRTTIIERGMLRGLLTTRQPVEGIPQSTGNKLSGNGPVPTNLIVETNRGLSDEELMEEFQLLVNDREMEFGMVVKRIAVGLGSRGNGPHGLSVREAYRVYEDGEHELVQQSRISQFMLSNFKDIIAASENINVKTRMGRYRVGPQNQPATNIMTVVTPDLLFEDITMNTFQQVKPKPPILTNPRAES